MRRPCPPRSSFQQFINTHLPFLLLAAGLVCSGCSSVKTHVDRGHVTAATFSFLNTGAKPSPSYADSRQEVHALVQQAITRNLAAKGIRSVPSGGAVTVAYLIVAGNNATTTSLNDYFGYNSDTSAFVDKVHEEQAVKGKSREYFEAGTLVVDILEPATSRILQRRSIQAQVLRNLPVDARANRIQAIVDQALKDVPISP